MLLPMTQFAAVVLLAGLPAVGLGDSTRTIPASEAAFFIGQRVTVEGIVAGVRKTSRSDVWLDLERKSPRQVLSAVVAAAAADAMPRLEGYAGKRILVTGVVERIGGVLRIQVTDPAQLRLAAEPNRVPCDD